MSAHVDAINEALNRLLAQDSWEAPYVMAAKDALAALAVVERERDTLRAALGAIAAIKPDQTARDGDNYKRATKARDIARTALSPEGEA
jgi:hypothetical protein